MDAPENNRLPLFDFDFGWLVGIVEGEGYLGLRGSGRGGRIRVAMTDRDVVERLHEVAGVGFVRFLPTRHAEYQDQWSWEVGRWQEVEFLLTRMLPYLGERRAAAARMILANPPMRVKGTRSHCARGHLRSPDNRAGDGRCLICRNEYNRMFHRRRRDKAAAL